MGPVPLSFQPANIREGAYVYREDLLKLDSCIGPSPAAQWPVFQSPFRLQNWGYAFQSHPDKRYVSYIQAGLTKALTEPLPHLNLGHIITHQQQQILLLCHSTFSQS